MGDMYYFFTGTEMRGFMDYIASPYPHAVWDTGHGNLTDASQYNNITALGSELHVAGKFILSKYNVYEI